MFAILSDLPGGHFWARTKDDKQILIAISDPEYITLPDTTARKVW